MSNLKCPYVKQYETSGMLVGQSDIECPDELFIVAGKPQTLLFQEAEIPYIIQPEMYEENVDVYLSRVRVM